MSKKKQKKSIFNPVGCISIDNVDRLLGDYASVRNRHVSELLEIAFEKIAAGADEAAFPIKGNGRVSLKNAFMLNRDPVSKRKKGDFAKLIKAILDVAATSQHANEVLLVNSFDIVFSERSVDGFDVISVVALKRGKNAETKTPSVIFQGEDKTSALSVPLIALMRSFSLSVGQYTCVSNHLYAGDRQAIIQKMGRFAFVPGAVGVGGENARSHFEIYSQCGTVAPVSEVGFHDWLFNHFVAAELTLTVIHSVNQQHGDAMSWQENEVAKAGHASLHITPGGMAGRLFLQKMGLLGSVENVSEHEFFNAIERYSFMPARDGDEDINIKARWKESWGPDVPGKSHLTPLQVSNIRRLDSYGLKLSEVVSWVGASNTQQVQRVLNGKSFKQVV